MTRAQLNTKDLLHLIASHLSGRQDCRQVEYIVRIEPINLYARNDGKVDIRHEFDVQIQPNILVYPNRHNRKQRVSVVAHVLGQHWGPGNIPLQAGTYLYQKSFNGRRRRWIRIR